MKKVYFCRYFGCIEKSENTRNDCPVHGESYIPQEEKIEIEIDNLKKNNIETYKKLSLVQYACIPCDIYQDSKGECAHGLLKHVTIIMHEMKEQEHNLIKNIVEKYSDMDEQKQLQKLKGVTVDVDIKNKAGHYATILKEWLLNITDYNFITLNDTREVYSYDDGIYIRLGESLIEGFVEEKMYEAEAENNIKTHLVKEVVEGIRRSTYIKRDELNPKKYIALQNGVFNLESLELESFSPQHYLLTKFPIKYNQKSDCPKFKQFLSEILTEENVLLVQELFGYCLLKDYRFQYLFLFHGSGSNGKSVLLHVLGAILGVENTCNIPLQELEEDKFKRAQLYNKHANIAADLPKTALNSTGIIKSLTGGDYVSAEFKRQDSFNFTNYAKIICSANTLPITPDDTYAFWRRLILIPFTYIIPDEKQDQNLVQKLETEEELSGIFNWAVEGLNRLITNKRFSYNMDADTRRSIYIKLSDPEKAFAEEMLFIDSENIVSKDEVYNAYKEYCLKYKFLPKEPEMFAKLLPKACGFSVDRVRPRDGDKRTQSWKGFRIKGTSETDGIDSTKQNYLI